MATPARFINDAEYSLVHKRVNQVICEYSKSADKTAEATLFLSKTAEKCTSREEFLKVVEQRLDLLGNPKKSQEAVDWFKSRRASLVGLLQSVKEKIAKDPKYLSKCTESFTKGVQSLDRLLKMDEAAVTHSCVQDLVRVQKLVAEMRNNIDAKSKAAEAAAAAWRPETCFLYNALHEILNAINLHILLEAPALDEKLQALLLRHQKALSDQQSTIKQLKDKANIDSAYVYRLDCTAALLADFLRANTTNTANATAPTETSAEGTECSAGTAPLPVSTIYAVLRDLKAAEWKYLLERQKFVKAQPDSAGLSKELESVAQVGRKRKSQVALEGVMIPVVAQKVVDQLQQQAVNVEAGDHSGRLEHYGAQVAARDEVVQHQQLPWSKVVNLAAFAGTCEAAAAVAAEKSVR